MSSDPKDARVDYTKYPDEEKRTPREVFTRSLRRICARLDACPVQTLTYKSWFMQHDGHGQYEALRLWVVGSYARGAAMCGDLDLVFEVRSKNGKSLGPSQSTLAKAFLGSLRDVRAYIGTPEENTSGAEHAEAILIWEPGKDWQLELGAIKIDSGAGRFVRPTDAIPLRREQSRLEPQEALDLVKAREDRLVDWTFMPLSQIEPIFESENPNEVRVLQKLRETSEDRRLLAPLVLGALRQMRRSRGISADVDWPYRENLMRAGGIRLSVARIDLNADLLDSLAVACVAAFPALTTRGPNGVLLIERGDKHPITLMFTGLSAWVHAYSDGSVSTSTWVEAEERYKAEGLEMYLSLETAQADAQAMNDGLDDSPETDDWILAPKVLTGRELLEQIAAVDMVILDGVPLPTTADGLAYCRAEGESRTVTVGPAELAALIASGSISAPDASRA